METRQGDSFSRARKPRQMRNKSARKLYNVERKNIFRKLVFHTFSFMHFHCAERDLFPFGLPDFPVFYFEIKTMEDTTKRFQI